jgi:hypothetical protein
MIDGWKISSLPEDNRALSTEMKPEDSARVAAILPLEVKTVTLQSCLTWFYRQISIMNEACWL